MLPRGKGERFTRIRNEFGTIMVGEEARLFGSICAQQGAAESPRQFPGWPHGGAVAPQQRDHIPGQNRKSKRDMEECSQSLMGNKSSVRLNDSLRLFARGDFNAKKRAQK